MLLETATTAFVDSEKADADRYLQKGALLAEQAWQQTLRGNRGPSVAGPVLSDGGHGGPLPMGVDEEEGTSLDTVRGELGNSAPQLQPQLSQLKDSAELRLLKVTLESTGAWQQRTWIEDFCDPRASHKWLVPPLRVCRERLDSP